MVGTAPTDLSLKFQRQFAVGQPSRFTGFGAHRFLDKDRIGLQSPNVSTSFSEAAARLAVFSWCENLRLCFGDATLVPFDFKWFSGYDAYGWEMLQPTAIHAKRWDNDNNEPPGMIERMKEL